MADKGLLLVLSGPRELVKGQLKVQSLKIKSFRLNIQFQ